MGGGGIRNLVTQNLYRLRLVLIGVIYMDQEENSRSEVIDLHFDLHELRKYGKIPLFSLKFNYNKLKRHVFILFATT